MEQMDTRYMISMGVTGSLEGNGLMVAVCVCEPGVCAQVGPSTFTAPPRMCVCVCVCVSGCVRACVRTRVFNMGRAEGRLSQRTCAQRGEVTTWGGSWGRGGVVVGGGGFLG